jgi:NTP pyrophosphatase (non-canonical NTP hydrolase)
MDIARITTQHFDWVERMGWHNKTPLETLALIISEIGESVDECLGKHPTKELAHELADIVLRIVDFAKVEGINLTVQMDLAAARKQQQHMDSCYADGATPLEDLALMVSDLAKAVNTCRGATPTKDLQVHLADCMVRIVSLANWQAVNLALAIDEKLAINENRGTRGRLI